MRTTTLLAVVLGLAIGVPAAADVAPTPHLIPIQGFVTDTAGEPLAGGNFSAFIHDAAIGGVLVYYSGADFTGAIQDGVLDVTLGSDTPLSLDDTRLYHMTVVIDGVQFISELVGGRYAFYPGGGSHARPDLEARLDDLEAIFAGGKSGDAAGGDPSAVPTFDGIGTGVRLDAGLLGVGEVSGTGTDVAISANLLLQPVGVFTAGDIVLKMGPHHIPPPEIITGIDDPGLPSLTALRTCSPNPFNPRTVIRFDLAEPVEVSVGVHDLAGRVVRRLIIDQEMPAGRHTAEWGGRDDADRPVAAGVYLVRFRAGEVQHTRAVTLLK